MDSHQQLREENDVNQIRAEGPANKIELKGQFHRIFSSSVFSWIALVASSVSDYEILIMGLYYLSAAGWMYGSAGVHPHLAEDWYRTEKQGTSWDQSPKLQVPCQNKELTRGPPELVWLNLSPIPMGRRGVISSLKWFLPFFATRRGGGGRESAPCGSHIQKCWRDCATVHDVNICFKVLNTMSVFSLWVLIVVNYFWMPFLVKFI